MNGIDVENCYDRIYTEYIMALDLIGFRQGSCLIAKNKDGMSCDNPNTNMSYDHLEDERSVWIKDLNPVVTGNFDLLVQMEDKSAIPISKLSNENKAQKQRQVESINI